MKIMTMKTLTILTTLSLLGMVFSRDIGKGLFMTDNHYDDEYSVGSPANCFLGSTGLGCCRKTDIPIKPYRHAGVYGDYNCDSPNILVNDTIRWFSTHDSYDMIIWTGDSAGHHDITQSVKKNMNAVDTITNFIKAYFPGVPVYPSIGNHDTYPIDQLLQPPYNKGIIGDIAKMWKDWIPEDSYADFEYGGYYTAMVTLKLRLISINSLYYDNHNILSDFGDKKEPTAQWVWLKETLDIARSQNETVWIIGHIPPGSGEATSNFTDTFVQFCAKYNDIINLHMWGHTHHDELLLFYLNGKIIDRSFIIPSGMPDNQFPSVRVFSYDRDTYEIIDWDEYNLNLTAVNNGAPFNFYKSYSMLEYYNIPDLSKDTLSKLVSNFRTNSSLAAKYCANYHPGMNSACKDGMLNDIYVNVTA